MEQEAPDFRAIFEAVPGLYLVLWPDLTIAAASEAYVQTTRIEREKVLGRHIFEVFPDNPGDPRATGVSNLRASLERVLKHRRPDTMAVQKYDIRRPESEGGGFEERHWSPSNSPVLAGDGSVRYIIHRVDDVTEFIRVKERGNAQSSLAAELMTRAGQMEAEIYRRAQELQEANRQLRLFQEELERRVEARTLELSRTNEALRQSEEQLRQSQKLDAVGRLAGGVAHDFNNLLTVVLTYSEFLLSEVETESPLRGDLEEIRKAGQRAAELTRQMLAFSRQQVLDPQIVDLNDTVASLGKMLRRVLGEDIELRLRMTPGLRKVLVDPGQIEQVLMNLIVNARDAMPRGGKLTIETANVDLDEQYAGSHLDVLPGPHAMLAVSDTGHGMDRATQARVFEPFFTTKEQGKGTGLGLSTVFGIVKQSKGNIWLYSEPGQGTTFKLYFPSAAGEAPPRASPPPSGVGGTETILVVEDEDQVRTATSEILRKAGYKLLLASNGREAIALCKQHPGEIDLLVTDIVMPGLSGRELAAEFSSLRPAARVLFVSGYTDDVIFQHGVLDAGVAFLQKPLTPASLTQKVRGVLDSPRQ